MPQQGSNLSMGQRAVDHVAAKMRIGAANKLKDIIVSSAGIFNPLDITVPSPACVVGMRIGHKVTDALGMNEDETALQWLSRLASTASATGCGNCGEQAAIAFIWLKDNGVVPIEYMVRTNADHAFVVIGRSGPLDQPTEWGAHCVICDPWDGQAYYSRFAATRMYGGGVFQPRQITAWTGG